MKINLNNINKQQLYTYILALLGFFILFSYMWFRFIRTRLPREIPYTLTLLSFFIIIIIISSLMYVLYRLKYPKQQLSQSFYNLLKTLSLILKPLETLDNFLKKNVKIQRYILVIFANIIAKFTLYISKKNTYLFNVFFILPKIVILLVFIFDIFYIHKIELFYYFLLLNLIPLIFSYFIYTLKKLVENYTLYLEQRFYIKMISTDKEYEEGTKDFMCAIHNLKDDKDFDNAPFFLGIESLKDIRFFIDIQAYNLIFEYDLYEYTCIEKALAREEYANKHNLVLHSFRVLTPNFDKVSIKLREEFEDIIPKVIYIHAFLDVLNNVTKITFNKSWINKLILIGYIICWTYILMVSIHTLNLEDILALIENSYKNVPNPFTDIPNNHEETILLGFAYSTSTKDSDKLDYTHNPNAIHHNTYVTIQGDQRLVFGMLTSLTEGTIVLSEKQPFDFDNKNKKQYFTTFKQPFLLNNKEYFKPLDTCILEDGRVINQQQIGHDYITIPEVKQKLEQQIETKVIPQIEKDGGHVFVYTGLGVTHDDIIREQKVAKYFKDYLFIKKQLDESKLQRTLKGIKKNRR